LSIYVAVPLMIACFYWLFRTEKASHEELLHLQQHHSLAPPVKDSVVPKSREEPDRIISKTSAAPPPTAPKAAPPPLDDSPCPALRDFLLLLQHDGTCLHIENHLQTMQCPPPFSRQAALDLHATTPLRVPLQAYLEGPLNDTIPHTGSRGNLQLPETKERGTPPDFFIPLPLRTQKPNDLDRKTFVPLTCHDVPHGWPTDRGIVYDEKGESQVWNTGKHLTDDPCSPVDADPFLPWIHDVFLDNQGLQFVAQNRRRCRTGADDGEAVTKMVPQVALLQPVSVQRLDEGQATVLAPNLWKNVGSNQTRYRLVPFDEADAEETRFICRFHLHQAVDGTWQDTIVGETLSIYPFNYEHVAYRKGHADTTLLTPRGKDSRLFWTSTLRFTCPLPASLQTAVASGYTTLEDGTPLVTVDVVPIRTSVRYDEIHLPYRLVGPNPELPLFNASLRWGTAQVLPDVQASGRWTGIPACPRSTVPGTCPKPDESLAQIKKKPHLLSACLWASAEFKTRGVFHGSNTDTAQRLHEWLDFHLLAGFDHVYVYDNSGAHSNTTSLAPLLAHYPPEKVTRIDWPSVVCNNNIPAHDSPGERSSQYAAENSCRTRYASNTEWIAAFDTDEYMVPMGDHASWKTVLDQVSPDTHILSLRSSRGRLRQDCSEPHGNSARVQQPHATFLQAYNCDSAPSPKPAWADRARKQLYRTDYVLYHFVHYSTVTQGYMNDYQEDDGWTRRYREKPPSERVTDEYNEGVLVHTKSLGADMTQGYLQRCRYDYDKKWQGCWVAYPHWTNVTGSQQSDVQDENGMEYNCWINERVEQYWVPKLQAAMAIRQAQEKSREAREA